MKKRIISLLLVIVLVLGICPITVTATAADDYTQWKQGDPEWNQQPAWPSNEYPAATLHYMSEAGCLVTSIAMLLRHYNVVAESSVNAFNPWICNEALKAAGALDSAADLKWGYEKYAYPGFVYSGNQSYSLDALTNLYNSGYACIVKVNGSGGLDHYVAVHSINGSTVTIMDPGGNCTALSSYYPSTIFYYTVTPATPSLIAETYPSYCVLEVTSTTYIKTLPCSQKTDASSANVEKATKGEEYQAIGLYKNTQGNLWYQVITKSGATGYMYAGDTKYKTQSIHDITATGVTAPANHRAGQVYVLTGTVSSTYNQLTEVSAYVHAGNSEQGSRITGAAASVSGNFYSLGGSSIDKQTEFNILPDGVYTYIVSASYKNCYAKSSTTVGTNTDTIGVYKAVFQVGNEAASCSHSYSSTITAKASCTASGVKTYTCNQCSHSYTETIAATGHNLSSVWGKDSDGHWHNCVTCGIKCDYANHDNSKCTVCGYENAHIHTLTLVPAKTATYAESGNIAYYTCVSCGDFFEDSAGTVAIPDTASVVIPKLEQIQNEGDSASASTEPPTNTSELGESTHEHVLGAVWYRSETEHWHICVTCREILSCSAHDYGSGTNSTCSVCGYDHTDNTAESTGDSGLSQSNTGSQENSGILWRIYAFFANWFHSVVK